MFPFYVLLHPLKAKDLCCHILRRCQHHCQYCSEGNFYLHLGVQWHFAQLQRYHPSARESHPQSMWIDCRDWGDETWLPKLVQEGWNKMFQLYNIVMIMIQYEDLSRVVQFCQTRLQSYGLQMTFRLSSQFFFFFFTPLVLSYDQTSSRSSGCHCSSSFISWLDSIGLQVCPLESSWVNWTWLKGIFHGDGKRKRLL